MELCWAQSPPTDEFQIHNAKLGKGGMWLKVGEGTCISSCTAGNTNTYWQIGTTNVLSSELREQLRPHRGRLQLMGQQVQRTPNANGMFEVGICHAEYQRQGFQRVSFHLPGRDRAISLISTGRMTIRRTRTLFRCRWKMQYSRQRMRGTTKF